MQDLLNVTPLTTVIWNSVEQELYASGTELSCESIIENQQLRQDIEQRLIDQEIRVAQRYNITVDSLYSDYVANGNSSLHGLARSLVPGLAKSYAETVELEAANPNANYVFVEYYFDTDQGGGLSSKSWTRREFIQQSAGNWDELANAMSGGLQSIGALKYRYQQRTTQVGNIEAEVALSLVDGVCNITEYFTEIEGGVGFGLANTAFADNVDWSMCKTLDRVALNTGQLFITKTFYSDDETVKTESIHSYSAENPLIYTGLIGVSLDEIDSGWLAHSMSHISLDFYDDFGYDADGWTRIDNRYASENFWQEDQVVYMHNSDDDYTVTTYRPDGTNSKQCGTWSGGDASLVDCTE